jgi:hypothetical protein
MAEDEMSKILDVLLERRAQTGIKLLTDKFVRAVHDIGGRALSELGVVETDCDDCGALGVLIVIAPVNSLEYVLKETLESDKFEKEMKDKIKQGAEYNARKGFKIESEVKRNSGNERVDIKID